MKPAALLSLAGFLVVALGSSGRADDVAVDLSGYKPSSGIEVKHAGDRLSLAWPMAEGEFGTLTFVLRPGQPRLLTLATSRTQSGPAEAVLEGVEPVTFLTVGTRFTPPGHPPYLSPFNVFFDSPAKRPYQTYRSQLDLRRARVTSVGNRATVSLGNLTIGPFHGTLEVTVYAGARLVHVEAVASTSEDQCAFLYDAGLVGAEAGWKQAVWRDPLGQPQTSPFTPQTSDRAIAALHRVIAAEGRAGSIACFPPPHQYFFPRDLTDNLNFLWIGKGHRGLADEAGFGIRQSETGGGRYVPWFNAPPGTSQRLGVFYLLTSKTPNDALAEVDRFTHGDRFPDLPGYVKFSSHWHMAVAVDALARQRRGEPLIVPQFVNMFRQMGVNMVHLAEFHNDGHPEDPGPIRLAEMEAMFSECRRLSAQDLLFIPGEEANVYLGLPEPGKHRGHWVYLFPKPVAWIMKRAADQPFAEPNAQYGTLYRVGSRADMTRLLKQEHGLAWTAHPRIKASNWTPDIYRNEDFYLADIWLGGAWKAMPADLSRERLGDRVLDLLSDMDNWGQKKYVLGEVDVFELNQTHELYGHMNINYVKLDRVPKYDEGWQPLLGALRAGQFFVTTGEVLVPEFTVGGKSSGETLSVSSGERPELRASLDWTFPLRFAELISGDGKQVYRERIDLTETTPFGHRTLALHPDLAGRSWVRLEAWDVASNGVFTQPVWLSSSVAKSR